MTRERLAPLRIFVTGATGYLGSAIAARLARDGHDVQGMARTPEAARVLEASGVRPYLGDLSDSSTLLVPLKNCDAVVHAALDPRDRAGADRRLLDAVRIAALDGRVRRFLYTSGVWVHGDTGGAIADETSPLAAPELVRWRPAHENLALDLAEHEVHVAVFRPGMVYGERRGTFGEWFDAAKADGRFIYPGDGEQHWSMIHRDDVAEAYRLALETMQGGERFLLVDETRLTVRELADAVARVTGAEAVASGRDAAPGNDPPTQACMVMDQRFTAARARRKLSWRPSHTSFIQEAALLLREWRAAQEPTVA